MAPPRQRSAATDMEGAIRFYAAYDGSRAALIPPTCSATGLHDRMLQG